MQVNNEKGFSEIQKLDHLPHLEDLLLLNGSAGLEQAFEVLDDFVSEENLRRYTFTEKIDGAPSIIFGQGPASKKFFISTKSFFNKNISQKKICYSFSDIDTFFCDSTSLNYILKDAFDHLSDSNIDGIFQGDILELPSVFVNNKKITHLKSNLLSYKVPEEFQEELIDFGLCVHTKYVNGIPTPNILDKHVFFNHILYIPNGFSRKKLVLPKASWAPYSDFKGAYFENGVFMSSLNEFSKNEKWISTFMKLTNMILKNTATVSVKPNDFFAEILAVSAVNLKGVDVATPMVENVCNIYNDLVSVKDHLIREYPGSATAEGYVATQKFLNTSLPQPERPTCKLVIREEFSYDNFMLWQDK